MRTMDKKIRKKDILRMAAIVSLIAAMALFAVSCRWTVGVVRGSGDIVSQERSVSTFDELNFSGMGKLVIQQGDKESLVVEADDNIIDLIETWVRGGELQIKFRRGFNVIPSSSIKFFLTVKDLDRIDLSGAGDIDCENFETDDLEFNISGSGSADLVLDAERLRTKVSGLGDINLKGKVDSHIVSISGSGKYGAGELESRYCEVDITGLGSATVDVSEELDISISGAGNVYYTGDPDISRNISGLGRIKSLD